MAIERASELIPCYSEQLNSLWYSTGSQTYTHFLAERGERHRALAKVGKFSGKSANINAAAVVDCAPCSI